LDQWAIFDDKRVFKSNAINCHQLSSIVINCHQLSSIVINCHQLSL